MSAGAKLQTYLDRADELDGTPMKIVAYYARYYVVQKLMTLRAQKQLPKSDEPLLITLLDKLEEMKKEDANLMHDQKADQQKVEDFALAVFKKADDADRSGQGTKQTAMQFFYAAKFMDVLEVFDQTGAFHLAEGFEDKRKYAKYKAHYIRECLKQGIEPIPGPPGGETEQEMEAMFAEEEKKQEAALAAGGVPGAVPGAVPPGGGGDVVPGGDSTRMSSSSAAPVIVQPVAVAPAAVAPAPGGPSVAANLAPGPGRFSLAQAQAGAPPQGQGVAPPAPNAPMMLDEQPPPQYVQGVPVAQQHQQPPPVQHVQAFAQPVQPSPYAPQAYNNGAYGAPPPHQQAFAPPQQQAFAPQQASPYHAPQGAPMPPPAAVAPAAVVRTSTVPSPPVVQQPTPQATTRASSGMTSYERKSKCRELMKTVSQCLDYDDLEGAKQMLRDAIAALE